MKITQEFETQYNVGDYVIFEKGDTLLVGIIEGFYLDDGNVWYNIRINYTTVFTYSNGGDIAEWWILCKLNKEQIDKVEERIIKKGK